MKKSNELIALISTASSTSTSSSENRLPGLGRDARDAIAVRMAQPVQAMLRLDHQLIALDPRARVIGRPQPDQLRA